MIDLGNHVGFLPVARELDKMLDYGGYAVGCSQAGSQQLDIMGRCCKTVG